MGSAREVLLKKAPFFQGKLPSKIYRGLLRGWIPVSFYPENSHDLGSWGQPQCRRVLRLVSKTLISFSGCCNHFHYRVDFIFTVRVEG
jgi:hypothetical protein